MRCHCNICHCIWWQKAFAWLCVCLGFLALSSTSHGADPSRELYEVYLSVAFRSADGRLSKPDHPPPFTYQIICSGLQSDRCNRSLLNNRFRNPLGGNGRFELKGRSRNPDIRFIYADSVSAVRIREQLTLRYESEFIDAEDEECQLYFRRTHSKISGVVLVLSLDAPVPKQRFCLSMQLIQAMGLSLPEMASFSTLWKRPPSGQATYSDGDASKLVESYGVLSYVHLCPTLKAGMNVKDVVRILSKTSSCVDGLIGRK